MHRTAQLPVIAALTASTILGCAPADPVEVARQPLWSDEDRVEVLGRGRLLEEPYVLAGAESDSGDMPHLISDQHTMQTVAFENHSTRGIEIATRTWGGVDDLGFVRWDPWYRWTAFRDRWWHISVPNTYVEGEYEAPYLAIHRTPEGEQTRWMSFTRITSNGSRQLYLARRVDREGPILGRTSSGSCGADDGWECYRISHDPRCDPLLTGDAYFDDGPTRFRAPFLLSHLPNPENEALPGAVNIAWSTRGVAVAAHLDPATGDLRCWKVGDAIGTFDDPDQPEPSDVEVDADYVSLVPNSRWFLRPFRAPGAHVFTGEHRVYGSYASPGFAQFWGSDVQWTPLDFLAQIDHMPGAPSVRGPHYTYGAATFGPTPSSTISAFVSTGEPFPDTMDPCPEGRPFGYFHTTDAGLTWHQLGVPPLESQPRVCHGELSTGTWQLSGDEASLLFFYSGSDLRVAGGLQDGSAWSGVPQLVDSVHGVRPSAVVEITEEPPLEGVATSVHYFVHTVAYYDRDSGDLRIARGSFF